MAGERAIPADDAVVTADAAALAECEICLVAVKSGASEEAGKALAPVLSDSATVVSLQNGLGNVDRLRRGGLTQSAYSSLVVFNVHRPDSSTFVQATDGPIMIERSPATERVHEVLEAAGVDAVLRDDLDAVQTTKLLLNLNNGLCALTGLPIRESILSKDLRWCFSTCICEGMHVMKAAGLPIVRIGRLSPPLLSRVLLLPNFIVERISGSFMKIDPGARSSTLQDLDAGKKTEIDYLNGEIVNLADRAGISAPANRFVTTGVHRLEESGETPPPFRTPAEVRAGIAAAIKP